MWALTWPLLAIDLPECHAYSCTHDVFGFIDSLPPSTELVLGLYLC